MNIYTIGFTKKNAETFFKLIRAANITQLIDVRLNTTSQLAGFAKRDDLKFFLKELCNVSYIHMSEFAPTKEILNAYKKKEITWGNYYTMYNDLLKTRNPLKKYKPEYFDKSCLLCSEHEPSNCHRRLAAEYINIFFNEKYNIKHLF